MTPERRIAVTLPESVVPGVFADFVSVWHTGGAFTLDFAVMVNPGQPGVDEETGEAVTVVPGAGRHPRPDPTEPGLRDHEGPRAAAVVVGARERHRRGDLIVGLLDDLRGALAADDVVVDPDRLESYRNDQAPGIEAGRNAAGRGAGSVDRAGRRRCSRPASAHRVPVVPRGAGSGLSGGANAVDGCVVLSLEKMNQILEIHPGDGVAVVQPGVVNDFLREAAGGHGLTYSPGPVVARLVHHRRQRRHQRRWSVLREVRRHPGLGAGARGGARRRQRHARRAPQHQGRRRLRPRRSLRGQRGDLGGGDRGDRTAPPQAAARDHRGRRAARPGCGHPLDRRRAGGRHARACSS